MNEDQQKLAKSFASMGEVYDFIKADLLDFGIIDIDAPVAEIGAIYKAREELKKELRLKFKAYELLD